jgi:uncharacterized tellurite resistance protein B-like protein
MSMSGKEAMAALRVLVHVAKCDGKLHEGERRALQAALEGAPLPHGKTLETMLADAVDFDAQLAELCTDESREQTFESAWAIAWADGACSPEEQQALAHMASTLAIPADRAAALEKIFATPGSEGPPPAAPPIAIASARTQKIAEQTRKSAVLAAAFCAAPMRGIVVATEIAVNAVQTRLIRFVAATAGKPLPPGGATRLLHAFGVGTPAWLAAANLSRLVPGWMGSFDAAAAFAATHACGTLTEAMAASGEAATIAAGGTVAGLEERFEQAEREARLVHAESGGAIAAREASTRAALSQLADGLSRGAIDRATFERRAAEMA